MSETTVTNAAVAGTAAVASAGTAGVEFDASPFGNVIFSAKNIKKYYGATHANDDVSVTLRQGEVKGLIGENGCGKSTIISIISGMNDKDSGTMEMNGAVYEPHEPLDAGANKIGTVVQELGLIDGLPVSINVFLGRSQRFTTYGVMNVSALYGEASALFSKWGFDNFPVTRLTSTLSVEEKKIVELVRALSVEPDVLILDEITQALSLNYRNILFGIIKQLKAAGKAVMLVTHDVEEMVAITDSITVMRDGKVVRELNSDRTDPGEVKRLMVGRDIKSDYYRSGEDDREKFGAENVLEVRNLSSSAFEDVSFDLRQGEILGFCGLSDAGIHELAEALFAVRPVKSGTVRVVGANEAIKSPKHAMSLKMGYVPKDRDKQALMVNDTIENNVALPMIETIKRKFGYLSGAARRSSCHTILKKFAVKTIGIHQIISGLSGGNRQKINLGRWIIQNKEILLLDCPTRGVDVGVKSYIYAEMTWLKNSGTSIIVVSDELPELIGMCDTLKVMKSGKIVKTFSRSGGFSEEKIIEVML